MIMTVIYKSIQDPIQIKKIPIHLWSLSDQVEMLLHKYLQEYEESKKETEEGTQQEQEDLISAEKIGTFIHQVLTSDTTLAIDFETHHDQHDILMKEYAISQEKKSIGHAFLSDINMDWIGLFCNHGFHSGQSILIDFQIPRRFIVNAKVLECRKINLNSRIISDQKMMYRIFAKFTFSRGGERTNIRAFVKHLQILYQQDGKIL